MIGIVLTTARLGMVPVIQSAMPLEVVLLAQRLRTALSVLPTLLEVMMVFVVADQAGASSQIVPNMTTVTVTLHA